MYAEYSQSKTSAEALLPIGSVDLYSNDSHPAKSPNDLLKRKDIEANDIVLQITNQPAVIEKALKAGKRVVRHPSLTKG